MPDLNPTDTSATPRDARIGVFGYAALILFFELAFIRYTAGYVRVFAFYLNFVLIATFLGMGVGLMRARSAQRVRWLGVPAALLLFIAVWYFARTPIAVPADPDEFVWGIFSDDGSRQLPLWLVVSALFALTATFFVPLGALLGREFGKLPALHAYAFDISGSLLGIVAFGVVSALGQPPVVWFAIGFAFWFILSLRARGYAGLIAITGLACIGLVLVMPGRAAERWSPYYRIGVDPVGAAYRIEVNGSLHQIVLDLFGSRGGMSEYARVARAGYEMPYPWVGDIDTALVVGSGTGNDLAVLLSHGVRHVDAVEIDPVIAELGRELHPQAPYADERVHLHIDDARAYLRKTDRQYDLIIFGTLDSQTLLSGMSSVRLDNYVYTLESFRAARERLTPDGSLVVFHRSPEPYIAARIYQMIAAAFDSVPGVHFAEMNLFNLIFVAGEGAGSVPPAAAGTMRDLSTPYHLAVDDWPYLYLRRPTIPGHYRVALLMVLGIAALFVLLGSGGAVRRGFDAPMFFLGAGFLLVETKSVTEMSLLFGSTWTVNLLVFSSILVVVLLANLWVLARPPVPVRPLFAALLAALLLAWLVPASSLLWLGNIGQWLLGGLMVALPILFAALIFSTLFRTSPDPPRALAWNLTGAIVGGVLEYASMAIGIKGLYLLGAVVYLLALLTWARAGGGARGPLSLASRRG